MKVILRNTSLVFETKPFTPIILDETAFIVGSFIRPTGIESAHNYFCCTDYINFQGAKSIQAGAIWGATNIAGAAFYDADKNFISSIYGISGMNDSHATAYDIPFSSIPANAIYVRFSSRIESKPEYQPFVNIS